MEITHAPAHLRRMAAHVRESGPLSNPEEVLGLARNLLAWQRSSFPDKGFKPVFLALAAFPLATLLEATATALDELLQDASAQACPNLRLRASSMACEAMLDELLQRCGHK